MSEDNELSILAEIEEEGYQDALAGDNFTQAPYKHGSKEWNAWRGGLGPRLDSRAGTAF